MPKSIPANLEAILLEGIDITPNCLGVINSDKEVIYCNQHYASIFGVTKEQAIGKKASDLLRHAWNTKQGVVINTNDFEQWIDNVHKLHSEKNLNQYETDLLDGRWFKMTRINLDSGNIIIMGVDITELKNAQKALEDAHQHIESLVNTDPLTSVHNRRSYHQLAKHEFGRALRFNQPLSLLVIDIDYFKTINDNFGHSSGDEILKEFAHVCSGLLRQSDSLSRIGGEEFTAVLPMTDHDDAMLIAERIRAKVAKHLFNITQSEQHITLTISIGSSSLIERDTSMKDLFSRADQALYCAKRGGRNQVQQAQIC
ncbi:diguanylate cyclase [Shewanella ulleungensis]|uniref:sensor domain-containing diguanylate cyclase n=1 Tax=Shewanella ulleungensis TaxID=2282699 RepID=UPI003D7B3CCF